MSSSMGQKNLLLLPIGRLIGAGAISVWRGGNRGNGALKMPVSAIDG